MLGLDCTGSGKTLVVILLLVSRLVVSIRDCQDTRNACNFRALPALSGLVLFPT